jgi:hypothetical protein
MEFLPWKTFSRIVTRYGADSRVRTLSCGVQYRAMCTLQKQVVELFFKWIKQHLRIKQFYGTSENAVKTQIWIAVSVYVLVAIVKKRLGLEASLYTLMQVLSVIR